MARSVGVIDSILNTIMGSLTTRIAPMIYIMMFISVFIGFSFMTGTFVASSESVLWSTGVLVEKRIWGTILFITAISAEIGFLTRRKGLIVFGGIFGFMVWLFACIALTLAAHWYVLVTVGLFHLLFHGYVYLATSLNAIERVATNSGP